MVHSRACEAKSLEPEPSEMSIPLPCQQQPPSPMAGHETSLHNSPPRSQVVEPMGMQSDNEGGTWSCGQPMAEVGPQLPRRSPRLEKMQPRMDYNRERVHYQGLDEGERQGRTLAKRPNESPSTEQMPMYWQLQPPKRYCPNPTSAIQLQLANMRQLQQQRHEDEMYYMERERKSTQHHADQLAIAQMEHQLLIQQQSPFAQMLNPPTHAQMPNSYQYAPPHSTVQAGWPQSYH